MAHYHSKAEWQKIERYHRSPIPRQEPKLPPAEKRHLTLQPFALVRSILPYRDVPGIIVKGRWLEEAGFSISDTVTVTVRNKKLIIQLDSN